MQSSHTRARARKQSLVDPSLGSVGAPSPTLQLRPAKRHFLWLQVAVNGPWRPIVARQNIAPKEEQPSLLAVGFEQITFYDGQEQVDLAVEIEVPGSWFGGTAAGTLNATERREKFKAQAVEYAAVHEFPAVGRGIKKTKEKGIRFLCIEDAADDPHSVGYWMKLSQWNRYRHDTYKDRQDAELPYIKERPSNETVAVAAPPTKEPKIKTVFEKKGTGMHKQGDG